MCFSVANQASFNNVKSKWIREVRYHLRDTPIILVACKIDLRSDCQLNKNEKTNPVNFEEGEELARELGCLSYWETSSLSGEGFDSCSEILFKSAFEPSQEQTSRKCFIQ